MFTKKIPFLFALVAALALAASPARAQIKAGSLRVGLDTRLLGVIAETDEHKNDNDQDCKYRTFQFGLGAPELGLTAGFAVIDGLVVGARVAVAFSGEKEDPKGSGDNRDRTFGLRIMPYGEYGFNIGKFVPFVAATLGYRNEYKNEILDYDGNAETERKTVKHLFSMGAGGGIHWFLVEHLSVDAALMVFGNFGKRRDEFNMTNGPDTHDNYKARAFEMNLLVGLSGWI